MNPDRSELYLQWKSFLPKERPKSIVEWARHNVKLVGSVLSETYNPDLTPWTKEPIECTDDKITRRGTFVKPIQSGGSEVGIIGILWRIATAACGDIQYNWPTDEKAKDKWDKQIEKKIKACKSVMQRVNGELTWQKGLVVFPHLNFTVQGVQSDSKATSDSITFQVNEELHVSDKGWTPGRLEQMHGRLTAVWNGVAFQISNAGAKGGELHQALEGGTCQHWESFCPGCGQHHVMRTRWNDNEPHLGGLRYDADGCRIEGRKFEYDYTKMLSTIRFQMPCGYEVREDSRIRRQMSLGGRYGAPLNKGASMENKSWTLEAVSVDYISFLSLIQQKHKALKSLAYGDSEPWWKYLRERECQFTSDEERPIVHQIVLSDRKKDRDGLKDADVRFAMADRQQGTAAAGELPHWWLVITDWKMLYDGRIHTLIVFEGKILTDEDLTDAIARHNVKPVCVCLDSGYDTPHVYQLAMAKGYNCVKDEDSLLFAGHEDGSKKIYSPEKALHGYANTSPKYNYKPFRKNSHSQVELMPDDHEPMFWFVSKFGMMDRVQWLRTSKMIIFEVPKDVSADFLSHMDAWSCETRQVARSNETVNQWVQHKKRDDLFKCVCYGAVFAEKAGLIGAQVELPKDTK